MPVAQPNEVPDRDYERERNNSSLDNFYQGFHLGAIYLNNNGKQQPSAPVR